MKRSPAIGGGAAVPIHSGEVGDAAVFGPTEERRRTSPPWVLRRRVDPSDLMADKGYCSRDGLKGLDDVLVVSPGQDCAPLALPRTRERS